MMGVFVPTNTSVHEVGYLVTESGCWEWVGAKTTKGYGKQWVDGKCLLAHRMMYAKEHGPIPNGLQVDHFACDNKACVNPAHLRLVTARENLLRSNGMAARNAAKTHCPRGHALVDGNLIQANLRQHSRACLACSRERVHP